MNILKTKIKPWLYKKMSGVRAERICRKVINKKGSNTYVIWLGPGLGDVIYGMAYFNEWRKRNADIKVVLIALDNARNIIETYGGGYNNVVYISPNSIYRKYLTCFWSCKKTVKKGMEHGFISTLIPSWIGVKGAPDALCIVRNDILKIGDEVQICHHNLSEIRPTLASYEFENNLQKTVLLNAYSNSTILSGPQIEYFEKICAYLLAHDFWVYSNVIGDQKCIKGSMPLKCSLNELLWIANRVPLIVSVRSGILDLLIKTPINMFVVYAGDVSSVYTLKAWGRDAKLIEVAGKDIENDEQIQIFKEFFGDLE